MSVGGFGLVRTPHQHLLRPQRVRKASPPPPALLTGHVHPDSSHPVPRPGLPLCVVVLSRHSALGTSGQSPGLSVGGADPSALGPSGD